MPGQALDKTGRPIKVGDILAYAKGDGRSVELMFAEVTDVSEGRRTDQSVGPIAEVLTYEFIDPGGEKYLTRSKRRIQFPERYLVIEKDALMRFLRKMQNEGSTQEA